MRECPKTGEIWVALKGSVPCHPGSREMIGHSGSQRVCCSPVLLAARMKKLDEMGYTSPPPEGFAVWRVDPDKYKVADGTADISDAAHAHGGQLCECPFMIILNMCLVSPNE